MDWSQVTALTIPEGNVAQIAVDDTVLWRARTIKLQIDPYRYYRYIRQIDSKTYTWVQANDSYSIVIPCKENTTYTIAATGKTPYANYANTILRIATTDQKIDKTISGTIPLNIVYYGSPGTQSAVTFSTGAGIQTIIVQMGSGAFGSIIANGDFKCYEYSKESFAEEYTQLKYIEADGTQWIETDISGFNSGNWEIYAQWLVTNTSQETYAPVFRVYKDEATNAYRIILNQTNNSQYYVSANSKAGGGSVLVSNKTAGKVYFATVYNNRFVFDGTESSTNVKGTPLPPTEKLTIFKATTSMLKGRLYTLCGIKDNRLKFNLIPARRNSDGEVGLYDLISKTFLTNSGTGNFIGSDEG